MDTESPMVLDNSVQETAIQQWRVPPLNAEGETVDIFSVPEYSQVGLMVPGNVEVHSAISGYLLLSP